MPHLTSDNLCIIHLLHHAPFTPDTFYTTHLFHQTPFTPSPQTFYTQRILRPTHTHTFLHKTTFTPETSDTKQLLHQTPFSPDFYTRHLLHQVPFISNTLYTKQLLHQTPFTPDTFCTKHHLHQTFFYTRHLLHRAHTWTRSNAHVCLVMIGTVPFVFGDETAAFQRQKRRTEQRTMFQHHISKCRILQVRQCWPSIGIPSITVASLHTVGYGCRVPLLLKLHACSKVLLPNHNGKNRNPKLNEVGAHQEFYPVNRHQNFTPRQSGKPTVSAISHRKWYRIKRCSGARTSFTSFEKVHTHTRHCRIFFFLSAIKFARTNQSCGSVFPESEIHEGVVLEVEYHESLHLSEA